MTCQDLSLPVVCVWGPPPLRPSRRCHFNARSRGCCDGRRGGPRGGGGGDVHAPVRGAAQRVAAVQAAGIPGREETHFVSFSWHGCRPGGVGARPLSTPPTRAAPRPNLCIRATPPPLLRLIGDSVVRAHPTRSRVSAAACAAVRRVKFNERKYKDGHVFAQRISLALRSLSSSSSLLSSPFPPLSVLSPSCPHLSASYPLLSLIFPSRSLSCPTLSASPPPPLSLLSLVPSLLPPLRLLFPVHCVLITPGCVVSMRLLGGAARGQAGHRHQRRHCWVPASQRCAVRPG